MNGMKLCYGIDVSATVSITCFPQYFQCNLNLCKGNYVMFVYMFILFVCSSHTNFESYYIAVRRMHME